MRPKLSRRDFLKLGGMSLFGLAFRHSFQSRGTTFGYYAPDFTSFDDSNIVRVATDSVSIYNQPSDRGLITGTWFRDDLVHVYEEVVVEEPKYNPVWYRVWGGYMHRSRLQRVKNILQKPMDSLPEGTRRLAQVTVPFTQAWRYTRFYGWQPNLRLYYDTVHWIDALEEGPDGTLWYRIFDHVASFPYHVSAMHLRPIPVDEYTALSPEVAWENKLIEVNLTTQTLTAHESGKVIFQTNISSGIPAGKANSKGISTKTPDGKFKIIEKLPSEHMGNGGLFADVDDYELPGVGWTSYFTPAGHAFHGTFWHENFGTPMSHGCVNMRTHEAKWLFRWATPIHTADSYVSEQGRGTPVEIHY